MSLNLNNGLFALTLAGLAATSSAQWVGTSIHPGGTFSAVYGAGSGIGLGNSGTSASHAGYWTNGGTTYTSLHQDSQASSIANDGDLAMQVGIITLGFTNHAARWFGTAASCEDMNPNRFAQSYGYCMSGNRMAGVGDPGSSNGYRALLWNGGGAEDYTDLTPAGANGALAYAMDGSTVGGVVNTAQNESHAAMWTGDSSTCVDLNPVGSAGSRCSAVAGGRQGGWAYAGNQQHAFLWSGTANTAVDLHPMGFDVSLLAGMSENYQVGGAYFTTDQQHVHAGLWSGTSNSFVDLNAFLPGGYMNSVATSIVEYGDRIEIYGFAQQNSVSDPRIAVMWTQPVPEPATLAVLALGLVGIARRRRRA